MSRLGNVGVVVLAGWLREGRRGQRKGGRVVCPAGSWCGGGGGGEIFHVLGGFMILPLFLTLTCPCDFLSSAEGNPKEFLR